MSYIMCIIFTHFEVHVSPDVGALDKAIADKTVNLVNPYVVRKMPLGEELRATFDAKINWFVEQFDQDSTLERGHSWFSGVSTEAHLKMLAGVSSLTKQLDLDSLSDVPKGPRRDKFSQVLLGLGCFACKPDSWYVGPERNDVAAVRLALQGERRVAVMCFTNLLDWYIERQGAEASQTWEAIRQWLQGLSMDEVVAKNQAAVDAGQPSIMTLFTLTVGDLTYIPIGWIMAETSLNNTKPVGLRCPAFHAHADAIKAAEALAGSYPEPMRETLNFAIDAMKARVA